MGNKKTWDSLTSDEKTTLLNHWFYYYGGVIMTLKDMEDFRALSNTKQDAIFDHIISSFMYRRTIKSNALVKALREGKIDELFSYSISFDDIVEYQLENVYEEAKNIIFNELLQTFIYPQPPVPMDVAIVIEDEDENNKKL